MNFYTAIDIKTDELHVIQINEELEVGVEYQFPESSLIESKILEDGQTFLITGKVERVLNIKAAFSLS
jgi:hypothetical protein